MKYVFKTKHNVFKIWLRIGYFRNIKYDKIIVRLGSPYHLDVPFTLIYINAVAVSSCLFS